MATHGEFRWPPAGSLNGRRRGDSHGRGQRWGSPARPGSNRSPASGLPWGRRRGAVLLECLARRRRPRLRQLAKEVRLGGRDARDPLDVARSGTALQGVGDRLEGGLVDVERPAPRALARVDDPLVEFANPLLDCLDAGLGALRLSGRWWRPRPRSSGLLSTSRGLGGPGPCSRASLLRPAVAFFGCGIAASLCCAFANFETDGRDPTSGDAGLEARDGARDALIWRPRSARSVAVRRAPVRRQSASRSRRSSFRPAAARSSPARSGGLAKELARDVRDADLGECVAEGERPRSRYPSSRVPPSRQIARKPRRAPA